MPYDSPRPSSQPIGSTDLAVAKDNLITHDNFVSGPSGIVITNRKGQLITPLVDIIDNANALIIEAIKDAGGTPLGDGQWAAGKTYTAYNQFLVFNGIAYKPLSIPYLTQGADPTVAPDLGNVSPFQTIDELKTIELSLNKPSGSVIYSTDTVSAIPEIIYAEDQEIIYRVPFEAIGKTITSLIVDELTTSDASVYTLQKYFVNELENIAHSLNKNIDNVGYGDPGEIVKDIVFVAEQQVVYSVPAGAIGKTISSVVGSTLNTTDPKSYQLTKIETDNGAIVNAAPLKATLIDDAAPSLLGSNAVVFTMQQMETFNGSQYIVYWNSARELVITKRVLATDVLTSNTLSTVTLAVVDSHYNCSLAIDANGRLLISYNTRNSSIKWRYSTNLQDITAWSAEQVGMTGANEASAGYPGFTYGPSKEVLFLYRNGVSGNGDLMINAWDATGLTWSARAHNLINGTSEVPDSSPYWWNPPITEDGVLHVFWCYRVTGLAESNENMHYAKSIDGGITWTKSNDAPYALPITSASAEVVESIAQGENLLNQGNAAVDSLGNPHVIYQRNDAGGIIQLHHAYLDSGSWIIEQITDRKIATILSGGFTASTVMSRFGIAVYDNDDVIVFGRDREFGNGILFYVKTAISGKWEKRNVGAKALNGWEAQWDRALFNSDNKLSLLITSVSAENVATQDFSTLLEVFDYASLEAIPKVYSPKVMQVACVGRSAAAVPSTTSFTVADIGVNMAYNADAFGMAPTHARFITRSQNTTGNIEIAIQAQLMPNGAGTGAVTQTFGNVTYVSAVDSYIVDTGWQRIPLVSDEYTDTGFISGVIGAPTGGSTNATAYTLMLGVEL